MTAGTAEAAKSEKRSFAPYYETPDGKVSLYHGHILDVLRELPAESVNCVVTSPPYWSLRKYDCEPVIWGGDPDCPHTLEAQPVEGESYGGKARWQHEGVSRQETPEAWAKENKHIGGGPQGQTGQRATRTFTASENSQSATCRLCGAWLGQYGLEPTPELYVEHTLMWLREVRRVLRKDGTLWLNIGDGYASQGGPEPPQTKWQVDGASNTMNAGKTRRTTNGLKPKDAVLMPFRVALAAQADGWWVRSVIIWAKNNPMPESVRDRPTDAHEYIFLLTKSKRYWYDQDAVREPYSESTITRISQPTFDRQTGGPKDYGPTSNRSARKALENLKQNALGHRRYSGFNRRWDESEPREDGGRNLRSVWTFPTEPFPDAHFAVFPRELPERCIKAGCPEWVCPNCGKARVRQVNHTIVPTKKAAKTFVVDARDFNADANDQGSNRQKDGHKSGYISANETIGWTDCGCGAGFVGGVVLDPFVGSGTTCEVAYKLGRTARGVDASAKYLDMARERVKQGVLL